MAKKTSPEKIFETALEIFAKYGFRRTRVEDIATELAIATGTLYRYVKDKKDLYEKTVMFGIRRWQSKVFEAVAGVEDVTEQFIVMGKKGYGYLADDVYLRQILINDPSIFPLTPRQVRLPEIDTASINLIKSILRKGVEQKLFADIDINMTAELFYSFYVMFIIKTYIRSDRHSTQEMFEHGLSLILNGLIAR
jgi:AcrR family transcriptional regulator